MGLRSHPRRPPGRCRPARVLAPLLVPALASLGASAAAQEIATSKRVYGEGEAIAVTFDEAPGNSHDWITTVPVGAPPTYNVNGQFLWGERAGMLEFPALGPGVYEARLIDQGTSAPVATARFSVGPTCLDPALANEAVCDPSIAMPKDRYAEGEPLELTFEGIPDPTNDWVTIVPAGSPDGTYGEYHYVAGAGRLVFKGLPAGTYEARLHVKAGGDAPAVRIPFEVGPFESDVATLLPGREEGGAPAETQVAAAGSGAGPEAEARRREDALPEPGIAGRWIGYVDCEGLRGHDRQPIPQTTLLLSISGEEQIAAELFTLPRQGFGAGLRMSGGLGPSGRALTLSPAEWIYPPRSGQQPLAVAAELAENGLRMSGTVEGLPGCGPLEAFKYRPDIRPRGENGLVPLIERYGDAAVNRGNCVGYLRYASDAEFSEVDGVEVPSVLADGDGFHTMMGKTYDEWTHDDARDESRFWTQCVRLLEADRTNIEASQLAAKARADRRFTLFLDAALPEEGAGGCPHANRHLNFLTNYAALTGLRVSRLYADLDLEAARALEPNREAVTAVLGRIDAIANGRGPFTALPEGDRQDYREALMTERLRISEGVMDAAFARFDLGDYEPALPGLVQARADEAAMLADATTYAVAEQVAELRTRLAGAIAPLSETVTDQLVAAIPAPEADPDSLVAGRTHLRQARARALDHLAGADRRRVLKAYEDRNAQAARLIAPTFPSWLERNVASSEAGRRALTTLSHGMLGVAPDRLDPERVAAPYGPLAAAIQRRHEKLRFELCELPRGFEAYRAVICSDPAIRHVFEG